MHVRGKESALTMSFSVTPHRHGPQLLHYPHSSRPAHVCSSRIQSLGSHFHTRTISASRQRCKSSTLATCSTRLCPITNFARHRNRHHPLSLPSRHLPLSRSRRGLRRPTQTPFWELLLHVTTIRAHVRSANCSS